MCNKSRLIFVFKRKKKKYKKTIYFGEINWGTTNVNWSERFIQEELITIDDIFTDLSSQIAKSALLSQNDIQGHVSVCVHRSKW